MDVKLNLSPSIDFQTIQSSYTLTKDKNTDIYKGVNALPHKIVEILDMKSGNKILYQSIIDKLLKYKVTITPADLNALNLAIRTLKICSKNYAHNIDISMNFKD